MSFKISAPDLELQCTLESNKTVLTTAVSNFMRRSKDFQQAP